MRLLDVLCKLYVHSSKEESASAIRCVKQQTTAPHTTNGSHEWGWCSLGWTPVCHSSQLGFTLWLPSIWHWDEFLINHYLVGVLYKNLGLILEIRTPLTSCIHLDDLHMRIIRSSFSSETHWSTCLLSLDGSWQYMDF